MRAALYPFARRALWAVVASIVGLMSVAHAQAGTVDSGRLLEWLLPPEIAKFVEAVGIPGVLAILGWWARGIAEKVLDKLPSATDGFPVVMRLSDEDRALAVNLIGELRRLRGVDDGPTEPGP